MFQDWSEGVVLFLPAAGLRSGGGVNYLNEGSYTSSVTSSDAYGGRILFGPGTFSSFSPYNRFWAYAIRLATVVSESAREVVLLLPAAGARTGGSINYVNGHTQYWTTSVASSATPYKFLTSNNDFRPLWTNWGAQMAAAVR